MKLRYLSGDFLSAYNELMEELNLRQAELDTKYQEAVDDLLEKEKLRLEEVVQKEYEIGEQVVFVSTGKTARVVGTGIDFDVILRDETDMYGNPYYGPGRFFSVQNARDEEVVMCEGALRFYVVEREAHEIEADWGYTSVQTRVYPDEIRKS